VAAASINPDLPSPLTVVVGSTTAELTLKGILLGAQSLPDTARPEYRTHVADGEPTPVDVRLAPGIPVSVTIMFNGQQCGALTIDPSEHHLWTASCK
jgi:hypothetical protein